MERVMRKRVLILLAIGIGLVGITIGGVAAATGGDSPQPPTGDELLAAVNDRVASDPVRSEGIGELKRVQRDIFATARGDRANVDLLAGKGSIRCVSVSGDAYGSAVACFDMKVAAKDGSYQVVIPEASDASPLVIGFAPSGTSQVAVRAGGATEVAGVVRGQVFLATLEQGALGDNNSAPVIVRYGS